MAKKKIKKIKYPKPGDIYRHNTGRYWRVDRVMPKDTARDPDLGYDYGTDWVDGKVGICPCDSRGADSFFDGIDERRVNEGYPIKYLRESDNWSFFTNTAKVCPKCEKPVTLSNMADYLCEGCRYG